MDLAIRVARVSEIVMYLEPSGVSVSPPVLVAVSRMVITSLRDSDLASGVAAISIVSPLLVMLVVPFRGSRFLCGSRRYRSIL